ncbi:hypothetical protein V1525DRAFT_236025 [Lipomyces kononenkoae]|uniref:Uncharacterized protein n=1 Tax=Lipomyces kononenkoae TaxID=34357 RepID=A0ACC3SWQ5_LIPKO
MAEVSVHDKTSKKRKRHSEAGKVATATASPSTPQKSSPHAHKRKQSAAQTVLSQLPLTTGTVPPSPLGNPTPSQSFFIVETSMYVSIAPIYSLAPLQGIRAQHLDPLTMTYYPPVSGVVLACLGVSIDDADGAKVARDSPFAFVWITTKLLVWRPQRGDILQGRINLQSRSHIGLLSFDVFNASITRDKIPATWKFIEDVVDEDAELGSATDLDATGEANGTGNGETEPLDDEGDSSKGLGYWVNEMGKKIEGKLTFIIESLQLSGRLFSLDGSLLKLGDVKEDLTAPRSDNS